MQETLLTRWKLNKMGDVMMREGQPLLEFVAVTDSAGVRRGCGDGTVTVFACLAKKTVGEFHIRSHQFSLNLLEFSHGGLVPLPSLF